MACVFGLNSSEQQGSDVFDVGEIDADHPQNAGSSCGRGLWEFLAEYADPVDHGVGDCVEGVEDARPAGEFFAHFGVCVLAGEGVVRADESCACAVESGL